MQVKLHRYLNEQQLIHLTHFAVFYPFFAKSPSKSEKLRSFDRHHSEQNFIGIGYKTGALLIKTLICRFIRQSVRKKWRVAQHHESGRHQTQQIIAIITFNDVGQMKAKYTRTVTTNSTLQSQRHWARYWTLQGLSNRLQILQADTLNSALPPGVKIVPSVTRPELTQNSVKTELSLRIATPSQYAHFVDWRPLHLSAHRPFHSIETAALHVLTEVLNAADRGDVSACTCYSWSVSCIWHSRSWHNAAAFDTIVWSNWKGTLLVSIIPHWSDATRTPGFI